MSKRIRVEEEKEYVDISPQFIEQCEKKFKANPANIIARNAINSTGLMFSTMNSTRVNETSHIFLNSVKKHHLRATNQGASGRCWMFAALNTFRHILINSLNLEDFEFSEVYLFFWDKLERSNSFLKWFIDHPEYTPKDRAYQYMLSDYMNDGGWWNTFANLVMKYGLVPKSAMKETFQSDDSRDMNKVIEERLVNAVNYICNNRARLDAEKLNEIREKTVAYIYDTLVKFLGEPPKKFEWGFITHDEDNGIVANLDPKKFLTTVAPTINMVDDFIILAHIPRQDFQYYTKYEILYTNNVVEGQNCEIFNVPIEEMAKYAMTSILKGLSVWFVGDVNQSFNWITSTLDDELDDSKTVFGTDLYKFEKGDRMMMRNIQGNHALCFTGFNLDKKGRPVNWQVENSWGYWDYETPGLDGFLNMSHSWFKKYVVQLVVHKKFLSRAMLKKLESAKKIEIKPWDSLAPALCVNGTQPRNYSQTHLKIN